MATYAPLQTPFEFDDRSGVTRSLYGCSVAGRFEFFERLQEVEARLKALDQKRSWQELYDSDRRLRFLINRCLKLNGIKLSWVTLDMVEQLIFHRLDPDAETWEEGWLISINRPTKAPAPAAKPMTIEDILAAISTHTPSLQEAIALTNPETGMPAQQLLDLLEARGKIMEQADPAKKEKAAVESGKRKAVEAFQRMQEKRHKADAGGA